MEDALHTDPEEKYEKIGILGEGSYGTVYKGRNKATQDVVALKVIPIEDDIGIEELMQEIDILKLCTDAFVVDYYEHYEIDETIWIVMELCDAGSVNDLQQICEIDFKEEEIVDLCASTLLGLEYLHAQNVIHRDVKAGNILLTKFGQSKLGDFGVSAQLTSDKKKRRTVIGTPFWMAPEVISEATYDGTADVWSLGITLIELAESEPPYANIHPMRAIFMIPSRPPPRFHKPALWSKDMNDFLECCLRKDPEERKTASELTEHPFVRDAVARLNGAKPRGASPLIQELVEDNIKEIEEYRINEAKREERSTLGSTDSGRGNTAFFKPLELEKTLIKSDDPQTKSTLVMNPKEPMAQDGTYMKYFASPLEGASSIIPQNAKEMVELTNRMQELELQFHNDIRALRKAYDQRRKALVVAATKA